MCLFCQFCQFCVPKSKFCADYRKIFADMRLFVRAFKKVLSTTYEIKSEQHFGTSHCVSKTQRGIKDFFVNCKQLMVLYKLNGTFSLCL